MLRAWLIDNNTKNWALGCYFVQFQKNSSFHRTIKRSPYKALFGSEPKIGVQSSHISKELLEKLVTEEDLDLLLKKQDHDITSTPEDLPVISLKNNNDASKYLLAPELIDYNGSTSSNLSASELIDCNASTSKDLLAPELIDYNASTSKDVPAPESINGNASTSKDLLAPKLIDYKASASKDLLAPEFINYCFSFQRSARQLETVNKSTSTPASTVKTSVVLLASEGKAAVNDSEACCVVCGMESTGAHSCAICKNQVHAICGNAVGDEGYGSKILCYLCQKEENVKYQRENAAKHLKRSAEKMKEVSLKKFKDFSVNSTVLVNVPKVDRGPLDGNNIVGIARAVARVLDTKNSLYQIGTSVGIIKDWLPRNALQIATTTFTEIVPRINLSLREIAKKLSLFEEPKIGLQSSHISKELLEKLVTEEALDLLLKKQDHDITSTPEDLPVIS
ncbi:integrase catalytic domain-containing protein [Trichonephila inaurata madagascariensis]|uniref:Integrase catalytic domain-containing protein n=1 Tax=Trichonephila inaurata madagascariensis TaxID=2747483 RepID=A0A8X6WWL6_9ARAC|nr:integrase catalytic domain-containing protein [Trichonephila inaurata madagascariensis]